MTLSVQTNASALVALQNLNRTNTELENVQTRINTGLKVSGAKENASVFAVAQGLRSDLGALEARPGAADRVMAADMVQEIVRKPLFALIGGEVVVRRRGEDAADVEDDGFDVGHSTMLPVVPAKAGTCFHVFSTSQEAPAFAGASFCQAVSFFNRSGRLLAQALIVPAPRQTTMSPGRVCSRTRRTRSSSSITARA